MSFLYKLRSDYTMEIRNSTAISVNAVMKVKAIPWIFASTYHLNYYLPIGKGKEQGIIETE